jgi:hypothetical protein
MQIAGLHRFVSPAEFDVSFSFMKEKRQRFWNAKKSFSNSVPGKK